MQPQTPTPSEAQPATDAATTEEAGSTEAQEASPARQFINRLFRRRGAEEPKPEDQPQPPATSETLSLTQEEFQKAVQAETDRREAKRQADAKAAERRKLRDEDPYAYADADRQAENAETANAQVSGLFAQIGAAYDQHSLDPIVQAIPEADRKRILEMEGAGRGLAGRKLIVEEGLKALERHWKEAGAKDAEDKLRKNPAFRKQVLNEMRRDGVREPEFIGGGAPSAADQSVSNILREQLRGRRH